jgi:DeoR family fructose operon transcriptional repressor
MQDIRRSKIAEFVKEKGSASISELATMFGMSEITIHRDLEYLNKQGVLRRLRGGAVANPTMEEVHYPYRIQSCVEEKKQIAEAIPDLISEGDTILIDGSTTCIEVARKIKNISNITVFTNSPLILNELINTPNIILYCIGGFYSSETTSFIGSDNEEFISRLNLTKCIIGASAISLEFGVTDPYPQLVSVKRKIISASSQVILVADHTKFGRVALEKIAAIEDIDCIVVDSKIDKKVLEEIRTKTKVIVAK